MFSLTSSSSFALLVFTLWTLLFNVVISLPLEQRQDTSGPTTVMTTQTMDTVAGPMTEVCEITLTPQFDPATNEITAFEEVRRCTVTMGDINNAAAGDAQSATDSAATSSTDAAATSSTDAAATSSTDAAASPTDVAASPTDAAETPTDAAAISTTDAATASTDAAATTTDAAAATTDAAAATTDAAASTTSAASDAAGGPVSVNGVTSVPVSELATPNPGATSPADSAADSAPASDAFATETAGAGVSDNGVSSVAVTALSSVATDAAATATAALETDAASGSDTALTTTNPNATGAAAAVEASESADQFEVPGKSISVLPIGLGVFAGISVIALIIVGLVTYERTKYRKAFRQRKLAESGADLGYGGMAQRS